MVARYLIMQRAQQLLHSALFSFHWRLAGGVYCWLCVCPAERRGLRRGVQTRLLAPRPAASDSSGCCQQRAGNGMVTVLLS